MTSQELTRCQKIGHTASKRALRRRTGRAARMPNVKQAVTAFPPKTDKTVAGRA
jgi:hypothetical protein